MDTRDVITLPNGARIVFDAMPGLRTASVGVYLGAGARHEPAERNGLAHFLEHMAFKGAAGRSARGIAEAVEARYTAFCAAHPQAVFRCVTRAGDQGVADAVVAAARSREGVAAGKF